MTQTIKRGKHDKQNPYFMMSRGTAQDRRLSYEARGMLAYLLSKPGDWEVRVDDLILDSKKGEGKAGSSKIYAILDELAECRYVKKSQKYQGQGGKWCWTPYEVYEEPYPDFPHTDKPGMDKPDTAEPDTENRDTLQSTEGQITEQQITDDKAQSDGTPAATPTPERNDTVPSLFLRPQHYDDFMLQNMKAPAVWDAYAEACPAGAKPIITKEDKRLAFQVEAAGYTTVEVAGLTKLKFEEEKKDKFPFAWLVKDLPAYRLQKQKANTQSTSAASGQTTEATAPALANSPYLSGGLAGNVKY